MIKDDEQAAGEMTTEMMDDTDVETTPPEPYISDFMSDPNVVSFIEKQVQDGIKKALQGIPPKASTTNPTATEKANFARMTYKERLQLFQSNPHAYNKLKGGN